ncbi:hypothetical protein FHG87_010892 [Trinorchestia longiramus]|nr:hypothetical protein FHG87_010892 [Trinorchestia longiramus]
MEGKTHCTAPASQTVCGASSISRRCVVSPPSAAAAAADGVWCSFHQPTGGVVQCGDPSEFARLCLHLDGSAAALK